MDFYRFKPYGCASAKHAICGAGCYAECWASATNTEWKRRFLRDACGEDGFDENDIECAPNSVLKTGDRLLNHYIGRCESVDASSYDLGNVAVVTQEM